MFWRSLKVYIKLYFSFTRSEKIFLYTFFAIIAIIFTVSAILDKFFPKEPEIDQEFIVTVDSFYNALQSRPKEDYLSRLDRYIIKRYDTISLFHFDPNTTTSDEFKKLGLTSKQVKTIINYRNRGGKFVVKDDFRKIYGMRYRQYLILKPYIDLPEQYPPENKKYERVATNKTDTVFYFDPNTVTVDSLQMLGLSIKQAKAIVTAREKGWRFETKEDFHKLYVVDDQIYARLKRFIKLPEKRKIFKIELNAANQEQLTKLPGVGKYYAQKIANYRDKLGGFYSTAQVSEIYGFPPALFAQIKPFIKVDTALVEKININLADYKTFASHPYINSEMAGWIVRRRKRKSFTSVGELNQKGLISKEKFEKLKHYLTVE